MAKTVSAKAALTQVGVAATPAFLNVVGNKVTIKFPAQLGGGKLTFGGTVDADALAAKKFSFTTSDAGRLNWTQAFGISWLDLRNVALNLTIDKGEFAVSLDATVKQSLVGKGKSTDVVIDVAVEDGHLANFTLSLPKTKLKASSVPGLKAIPGAATFSIAAPTISRCAIGGQVRFLGNTVDAVAFHDEDAGSWNMALRVEKPITLGQLTRQKQGFVSKIGLPAMSVIVSTSGVDVAYDDLPRAVQNYYTATGDSLPTGDLDVDNGVTLTGQFDPAGLSSGVKNALAKIGLSQPLEVDGSVTGLFGNGPKAVNLGVPIKSPGDNVFTFIKGAPKAQTKFFLKLSESDSGVGLSTTIQLPGGKSKKALLFDVAFELDERDTEIEVMVAGDMRGDWVNAAGIRGVTLRDPALAVGINETGAFDVGLSGTVIVGQVTVSAAADLIIEPEALFVPEALAFVGTVNVIPFTDVMSFAAKQIGLKGKSLQNVNAEIRDLAFAFMTPGSHLPDDLVDELKIDGAGVAVKGSLWINNVEYGSASGYASSEGIYFDGQLDNLKLGPVDLKSAELLVQAGPSVTPEFKFAGDVKLFKGFEEKFELDIQPSKFVFSCDTKFGGSFDATLTVETNGQSLGSGGDLDFDAELAANYTAAFQGILKDALKGLKKGANDLSSAQRTLTAAQKNVDSLKKKVKAAKANATRAFNSATKSINDAKAKVDSLQRQIDSTNDKIRRLKSQAKSDSKHILKIPKSVKEYAEVAGLGTELAGLYTAKGTADAALVTARATVKVVPADAAPQVLALETEYGTATAALATAKEGVAVAQAADKGLQAATKAVIKATGDFKINKIGASGSLEGIVTGGRKGTPPVLTIDCSIKGSRHVYHVDVGNAGKAFDKLVASIAKQLAQELLDIFKS